MTRSWVVILTCLLLAALSGPICKGQKHFEFPDHALKPTLLHHLRSCHQNAEYCTKNMETIVDLAAHIVNDYSGLLLPDIGQSLIQEAFYHIDPNSHLGYRLNHILAVLAFSQGDVPGAEFYWQAGAINDTDIISMRSLSAQILMKGNEEKRGTELLLEYTSLLSSRFEGLLRKAATPTPRQLQLQQSKADVLKKKKASSIGSSIKSFIVDYLCTLGDFVLSLGSLGRGDGNGASTEDDSKALLVLSNNTRSQPTEKTKLLLLDLLLSEAQGGIRKNARISDVHLGFVDFPEMDTQQRFRLAVGLAKLGLFDLSLRHVWLSATPWEAPLYLFRAKLVFSPVHKDVRSLALAVDHFERQGEQILLRKGTHSAVMERVCDSPNEAALALQSLPLLHLAGCSSPRYALTLGHSPVALSVLMSEVFLKMCTPHPTPPHLHPDGADFSTLRIKSPGNTVTLDENANNEKAQTLTQTVRIGVVSGSLDGIPGKIVVGLMGSIRRLQLGPDVKLELIAMCFPTPRDSTTDRAAVVFDRHINLIALNKTQTIERILDAKADFILFADAALDSRVFALAHERLAVWQANLWGFGGTLGIKTIDFFVMPEPLLAAATCPKQSLISNPLDMGRGVDPDDPENEIELEYYENVNQPPQDLFSEQVIFLKGLPPLPQVQAASRTLLWKLLEERYLLPPANQIHLYLFPGSIRHMHPEFDAVLDILLKTDPAALVVMAVPRTGRDNLPTVHEAVRHDLMHPTNPVAAVSKLRQRLRSNLGIEKSSRVRILPPLDESVYHALRRQAIAVFDPYPVGMHVQILEALKEGIPVVSAPQLQECTHSHMPGIARALGLSFWDYPTTPEEYAVLAMRLQREQSLQMTFVPPEHLRTSFIPNEERHSTLTPDTPKVINHTDRAKAKSAPLIEVIDRLEDGTHGDQLLSFILRLKSSQEENGSTHLTTEA